MWGLWGGACGTCWFCGSYISFIVTVPLLFFNLNIYWSFFVVLVPDFCLIISWYDTRHKNKRSPATLDLLV
jgi:hypothetical protein